MHRVLVIVFDSEARADEGKSELLRLDNEGSISIYRYEVLVKKADGPVIMRQADGNGTLSPFAKSIFGRLMDSTRPYFPGSIPKPSTPRSGNSPESNRIKKGEVFIRDVMEVLLPHRVAIVAEVEEQWPTVLDRRMASMGGVIFRWTVSEVQHGVEM